jgi:hypothetical protein
MKVLFSTPKVRATSSNMGDGKSYPVEAWFQLVLHEGPPDPTTWEGCGETAAYWREQFKRLKDPSHVTMACGGADGVAEAVIPNEIMDALPDDARISMMWTVCRI